MQHIVRAVHAVGSAIGKAAFRAAPDTDGINIGTEGEIEPFIGSRDITHRQDRDQSQKTPCLRTVGIIRLVVETTIVAGKIGVQRSKARIDRRHPAGLACAILRQFGEEQIRSLRQCHCNGVRSDIVIDIARHASGTERRQLVASGQRFLQILRLACDPIQHRRTKRLIADIAHRL